MATATKQLEAIYQEITEKFSQDKRITVTPLDGEPPEKYEVTYHITGVYKDDSGDIQEKETHTITISIPFGFPHFPPSCKPKSAIFHPDFDPAAICIGDFWEKDRSITDLILHIGQMILGNSFSTSNAFNEEAAKWYKDNRARLPFDETDLFAEPEDPEEIAFEHEEDPDDVSLLLDADEEDDTALDDLTLEPRTDSSADSELELTEPQETEDRQEAGVDTLDESFLETDFDYLGSEDGDPETSDLVPPEADPEEAASEQGPDIDRFKLLAKNKRFFELDTELASLPEQFSFPEKDSLQQRAADVLQQAQAVYSQGSEFEHQGNPGRALEAFKQVESLVSDYPGLEEDLERTAQAKELLGDWVDPSLNDPADDGTGGKGDTDSEEDLPPLDQADGTKSKSAKRTFFEETAKQTSRIIPYAFGLVLFIVAATAGYFYFVNSARLGEAQRKFDMCQKVLTQNRFTETERQCEAALDIANQIQIFKSGARDELIAEIESVLRSQVVQEGLKGNLLMDGKYLPKEVVKTVRAFKHFTAEGNNFFEGENWQKAVANYQQALQVASEEEVIDPELLFAVEENLKIAEFNVLYRSGSEFIKREKWVLATQDLKDALEMVQTLNIENRAVLIDEITAKLAEISLATSKEQGDIAFSEQRWDEALVHYKDALEAVRRSLKPGDPAIEELRQLIVKAELYGTINTGKTAFNEAEWDKAIESYEQAIKILESNQEVLQQSNTEENRKKLGRIMLQASIIRDKQEAAINLKDQQYLTAIEKLQSIIDSISDSEFKNEIEFSAVIKETERAIEQAETEMLLEDKIAYLEDNFKELFTKHYTASPAEALYDPKVIFEKRLGDKLLFRLQCIERGRGRPLRLVMKYIHDLNTGQWSFYSGND